MQSQASKCLICRRDYCHALVLYDYHRDNCPYKCGHDAIPHKHEWKGFPESKDSMRAQEARIVAERKKEVKKMSKGDKPKFYGQLSKGANGDYRTVGQIALWKQRQDSPKHPPYAGKMTLISEEMELQFRVAIWENKDGE